MTPHIIWRTDVPRELRDAVEPLLEELRGIMPRWCHEITVRWVDDNTTAYAEVQVQQEYRAACLKLCPSLLSLPAAERRQVLLHELLHLSVNPLLQVLHDLLGVLPDTPKPLHEWAKEQARAASEGAVCDLEGIVSGLLGWEVATVARPPRSPYLGSPSTRSPDGAATP